MSYPKIVYPASGGTSTTLNFTYPPVKKAGAYPFADLEAVGAVTVTVAVEESRYPLVSCRFH